MCEFSENELRDVRAALISSYSVPMPLIERVLNRLTGNTANNNPRYLIRQNVHGNHTVWDRVKRDYVRFEVEGNIWSSYFYDKATQLVAQLELENS